MGRGRYLPCVCEVSGFGSSERRRGSWLIIQGRDSWAAVMSGMLYFVLLMMWEGGGARGLVLFINGYMFDRK